MRVLRAATFLLIAAAALTRLGAADDGAMCGEHGVLETKCTKCDSKLAAEYQAKHDWCAEHGFPESYCPTCSPRSSATAAVRRVPDGAPHTGLLVTFKSPETARTIGIETVPAGTRPSQAGVSAPVKLTYDASRAAMVNARSPGVVRSIAVEVGARVRRGVTLALLESAVAGSDRFRLRSAHARLQAAAASRSRRHWLAAQGVLPRKDLAEAETEHAAARAEVDSLEAAVAQTGAALGTELAVMAPTDGILIRRSVTVGQLVDAQTVLFELVDPRGMWAMLEIPEADAASVAVGLPAALVLDGLPGRELTGRLAYLAPEVNPESRTVSARVVLDNADGALRANMFGQARILTDHRRTAVTVPRSALQRARDVSLVFVQRTPISYETRRVTLGAADDQVVEIASGVAAGEPVVTTGSFLLKTETLKDSIGAGCCATENRK